MCASMRSRVGGNRDRAERVRGQCGVITTSARALARAPLNEQGEQQAPPRREDTARGGRVTTVGQGESRAACMHDYTLLCA